MESSTVRRTRRGLIEWGIHLLAGVSTLMVGVPVLGSLLSPIVTRSGEDTWTAIGSTDEFPEGETKKIVLKVVKKDGYMESENPVTIYVSRQAERYNVFSATCTHLGCAVNWDAQKNQYVCPCHNGFFAADGAVIGGPPPKPLTRLQARVNEEGQLEVLTA